MRMMTLVGAAALSMVLSPAFAQMMPGDNPYDPGCNVNQGGNCGRQLDSWNHTWRRLGYPQEPGRGAYGTYMPGGGFAPNGGYGGYGGYGGGYAQQQVVGAGYGGYGGDPGYGGQGQVRRGMTRVLIPVGTWSRTCFPDGSFRCDHGQCPQSPCGSN